jgi:hypothetical protein
MLSNCIDVYFSTAYGGWLFVKYTLVFVHQYDRRRLVLGSVIYQEAYRIVPHGFVPRQYDRRLRIVVLGADVYQIAIGQLAGLYGTLEVDPFYLQYGRMGLLRSGMLDPNRGDETFVYRDASVCVFFIGFKKRNARRISNEDGRIPAPG